MSERVTIIAPMPGVFYRRPDPDEPVFVEVGDEVEDGQLIGLVGVMKSFHDVTADETGTVAGFHVENEVEIEAGDPLVEIEVG